MSERASTVLAHRLLGGDVVRGPEHAAGLGQPVRLELARDPEVGHLGAPLGVDQDVLRLHVAVDEPARRGRRRGRGRPRSRRRRLRRAAAGPARSIRCFSVSPSTYSKTMYGRPVVLAGVDHRDDVRMRELGDRARLAPEALDLVRLVGDLAVQDLDRDPALERLVAGEIDGRHAAAAELRLEPVAAVSRSRSLPQAIRRAVRSLGPSAGAAHACARAV